VNPLAFLVGPVQVKYGGDPKKTKVANLKTFINESAKTIRSNTGEINLDYGKGTLHRQHAICSGRNRLYAEVPLCQTPPM
jgi:hypothetical protein